jgi:hypothetical protein
MTLIGKRYRIVRPYGSFHRDFTVVGERPMSLTITNGLETFIVSRTAFEANLSVTFIEHLSAKDT